VTDAYRIASHTRDYAATDLSGAGAAAVGGRWNRVGTPMVYASPTISLAVLETMAHLGSGNLPLNRYIVALDIPARVFDAAVVADPPAGWDAEPASLTSLDLGEAWAKSGASAILRVPSVIVPEEWNILVNPLHRDAKRINAVILRKQQYDRRMRPGA
jgi:RES domain-containing protein